MMTSTSTIDALNAALAAASDLTYTSYPHLTATHNGDVVTTSWAAWVQDRVACATQRWPSEAAYHIISHDGDVAEADFKRLVTEAKTHLPVQVGARLTDGRRADDAATEITWLFIDIEAADGESVRPEAIRALHQQLAELGINHLITESPTSGMGARGLRAHLYVQLAPVVLPAASRVPRREVKQWWQGIYRAASVAIAQLVGLDAALDGSVDDLSQPCFVSSIPPGGSTRRTNHCAQGMALDIEAFVTALGHEVTRKWEVPAVPAPSSPPPVARAAAASATRTEGHTTGSLIFAVARHYGWLGQCLDKSRGMYAMRCPWAEQHRSDPRQMMGILDTSTVLFDNTTQYGADGGFDCKHNGCREANGGQPRSAADVLSLARRRGCSVLPDRPGWGGEVQTEGDDSEGEIKTKKLRDTRPRIVVRPGDLSGMRDAAIAALRSRADIFVRERRLVDLTADGPRVMPAGHLQAVLSEVAQWVTASRNEDDVIVYKPTKVPREVVQAILDAPAWPGIPRLRTVMKHPPMLADGSILTKPGYDADSQILYSPDVVFDLPESPSRSDAEAARDRLLTHIANTRFTEASGKSAWLAFVLTLTARTAVPTVPVFCFDAASAGSGKTSLVKIAYGLVYGDRIDLGATLSGDDAEIEKRLPAWSRVPLVVWDNVKHTFASPVVDQAITAGRGSTRQLGKNEALTSDFTSTSWAMTGNNLSVGDDAASRCVFARLDTPIKRQYAFAVDDVSYYQAQRARAVVDALTILRAFVLAGSPQTDGPYCRFVEWSRLIRQAVIWLGMADPVGAEVVDTGREATIHAMRALYQMFGETLFFAGDIHTDYRRREDEDDAAHDRRMQVVNGLATVYGKKIDSPARVGYALHKLRDATSPDRRGGRIRFDVQRNAEGAKTGYQLVFEAA